MPQDQAALILRLEATAERFRRDMERARRSLDRNARDMERRSRRLNNAMSEIGGQFGVNISSQAAIAAAAIAGVAKVINDAVRNGDQLRKIEARFTALTGSAERGAAGLRNVLDVAADTGAGIDSVASAFTRFTIAARNLGGTDDQVKQLTQSVLQLGVIGGSSQQQLSAGAVQLGQALASGRLQGDELRSIMENIPLVADKIAEGLGVSTNELRRMGAEGELTSRKVFDALLSKTAEVEDAFRQMPVTLDRAAGELAVAWSRFTAELDNSLGISQALVRTLQGAARLINEISGTAGKQRAKEAGSVGDLRARQRALAGQESRIPAALEMLPGIGPAFSAARDVETMARQEEMREINREIARRIAAADENDPRRGGAPGGTPAPVMAAPLARPGSPSNPIDLTDPAREFGFGGASGGGRRSGGGGGSRAASPDAMVAAMTRVTQSVTTRVNAMREEAAMIGKTGIEADRLRARFEAERIERDLLAVATREGLTLTEEQRQKVAELTQHFLEEADALAIATAAQEDMVKAQEDAKRRADELRQANERAFASITDAITNAVTNASSFEDALKRVALQLANIGLQAVFGQGPAGGAFNNLIGSGANGILGLLGSAVSGGLSVGGLSPVNAGISLASAASLSGPLTFFAKGGIVNGPAAFPMGRGTGIAGEAGPEAIMPLKRGPDGSLGVAGGGGGVVININAPGAVEGVPQQIAKLVPDAVRSAMASQRMRAAR